MLVGLRLRPSRSEGHIHVTIYQFPGNDVRKIEAEVKAWIASQPPGTRILGVEELMNTPAPPGVVIYQVRYLLPGS
jgi:hypothetical protein